MRTIKKRKVYSAEFKAKIGLEALRGEKTINEIRWRPSWSLGTREVRYVGASLLSAIMHGVFENIPNHVNSRKVRVNTVIARYAAISGAG